MKIGTCGLALGISSSSGRQHAIPRLLRGGGPIIPAVWPFVFITIACGAISGFHASSLGTRPRCLNGKPGHVIGYGSMLSKAS
jgi:carbon starvation protein CstA